MLVEFPSGHLIHVLPHRAARHNFKTWEACFLKDLMANVRPTDIVYDIGSEQGEFSALVASTGAEVHLFEPSPNPWPNVRELWRLNELQNPWCFEGFVSNRTTANWRWDHANWPASAYETLNQVDAFSVVTERPDIPSVRIDDYVRAFNLPPDILMIDVEGAEGLVLDGLGGVRPKLIYMSIHPQDFMTRFGYDQEYVFHRTSDLGYKGTFLGIDHESHWRFDR